MSARELDGMLAFVRKSATARDGAVARVRVPEPGPGQAVVKVTACGICGSDLHALNGDRGYEFVAAPVILGHEFSGVVESVGAGTTSVAEGDPVVAVSIQGCGECRSCRSGSTQLCPHRRIIGLHYDGGLAERVLIDTRHLVRVPAGVDLRTAAVAEPLSVAVHAVLARTRVRPGDRVVVSGPGTIGLLCARLAVRSGAEVLVLGTAADSVQRLPLAGRLGVRTASIGSDNGAIGVVRDHFGTDGPDIWLEASGAGAALHAATSTLRRGGQLTVVAMFARPYSLDVTAAVREEYTVAFSYASSHAEYSVALDLLADGVVDGAALLHEFPISQAAAAFEAAYSASVVKPLIVP